MIILSNCLTDRADEGCRKVAVNLTERILRQQPDTLVVACESPYSKAHRTVAVNKWMGSRELYDLLREKKQPLLYLPAPAKTLPLAIRLYRLSRYCPWGVSVVLAMTFPVDPLSKWLIRASGAKVLTLSRQACSDYQNRLGSNVLQLKTGVDSRRFCPVSEAEKQRLRAQYGIAEDKKVVLHIGHLKSGRNIGQLLKLDDRFHGILVVSTQTAGQQDLALRQQLEKKDNITLIDRYLPNVEQLYQLADVYLFPVVQEESCIDMPLSALEAAACGIPVVTTDFGEMKALMGEDGFYRISSFEAQDLNELLLQAAQEKKSPRNAVLDYDWDNAVKKLLEI